MVKMPKQHLGAHIGPAPTNRQLGIDTAGFFRYCTECGYRPGIDKQTGCFKDRYTHNFELISTRA